MVIPTRANTAEFNKKYFLGLSETPVVCTRDNFRLGRNTFAYRDVFRKNCAYEVEFDINDILILGDRVLIYDGAIPRGATNYDERISLIKNEREKILNMLEKHNL